MMRLRKMSPITAIRLKNNIPWLIQNLEQLASHLAATGHLNHAETVRMSIAEHKKQLKQKAERDEMIESMEVDDVHGDEWM